MSRKRAAVGNLVPHDMDAKHANLMQDYLLLQDEFDDVRDRVQSGKTRKATLLAEVRFLRRRLKKLKETPSTLKEKETASAIPQSTAYGGKAASAAVAPQPSALSPKNNPLISSKFRPFRKPLKINGSDHYAQRKAFNENIALVSALKTPVFDDRPNVFVTAMPEKRKISWQDQISLECK